MQWATPDPASFPPVKVRAVCLAFDAWMCGLRRLCASIHVLSNPQLTSAALCCAVCRCVVMCCHWIELGRRSDCVEVRPSQVKHATACFPRV